MTQISERQKKMARTRHTVVAVIVGLLGIGVYWLAGYMHHNTQKREAIANFRFYQKEALQRQLCDLAESEQKMLTTAIELGATPAELGLTSTTTVADDKAACDARMGEDAYVELANKVEKGVFCALPLDCLVLEEQFLELAKKATKNELHISGLEALSRLWKGKLARNYANILEQYPSDHDLIMSPKKLREAIDRLNKDYPYNGDIVQESIDNNVTLAYQRQVTYELRVLHTKDVPFPESYNRVGRIRAAVEAGGLRLGDYTDEDELTRLSGRVPELAGPYANPQPRFPPEPSHKIGDGRKIGNDDDIQ